MHLWDFYVIVPVVKAKGHELLHESLNDVTYNLWVKSTALVGNGQVKVLLHLCSLHIFGCVSCILWTCVLPTHSPYACEHPCALFLYAREDRVLLVECPGDYSKCAFCCRFNYTLRMQRGFPFVRWVWCPA